MTPPERRCGTCRWQHCGLVCTWSIVTPRPFWAPQAIQWIEPTAGTNCPAWVSSDAPDAPSAPILPAVLDEARTLAAETRRAHRELLEDAESFGETVLVVGRERFALTLTDRIERLCAALGVRDGKPPGEET